MRKQTETETGTGRRRTLIVWVPAFGYFMAESSGTETVNSARADCIRAVHEAAIIDACFQGFPSHGD